VPAIIYDFKAIGGALRSALPIGVRTGAEGPRGCGAMNVP
jgi:hypothetical protein